jgi:hypothetical protein
VEKIINRVFLLSLAIIVTIGFSLNLKAAIKNKDNITVKDNQIFLNDIQLTKSSCKKSYPAISPDKKKILFICNNNEDNAKIGILDIRTRAEKYIDFNDEYDQVMKTEWINNNIAGVQIHINPSLELYYVCDTDKYKILNSYFGYNFNLNKPKTDILYIQAPPHFSNILGGYSVMLNDAIIYKTDSNTKINSDLYPSKDFKKVAFYESNVKDETKSNIVIVTLENNKAKAINKIKWNKKMYKLKWDNENVLSIDSVAKYDVEKSKLISN